MYVNGIDMITFQPYEIKNLKMKNRIVMPPMCMYQATLQGMPTNFHTTHYVTRAIGGVGLIIQEATAVSPEGRITDHDLGIWNQQQAQALKTIVDQVHESGSLMGVQLAHAGRKCTIESEQIIAPSAIAFDESYSTPKQMSKQDIEQVIQAFADGAKRANEIGYDTIEIHAAHGYLLHEFLSPLSNHRVDEYGGSDENRVRLLKEVLEAIHQVWPKDKAIIVRVSASDYTEGGIDVKMMSDLLRPIRHLFDILHVSSGGNVHAKIDLYPGYQIEFARQLKDQLEMPVIGVGLIEQVDMVEELLRHQRVDMIALGRVLLRHPYWVLNHTDEKSIIPESYQRGF